jgi:hypothetical protein
VCTVFVEEVRVVAMKRVFGVKKDKTPAPTVEEATDRVSSVSLFTLCVCARAPAKNPVSCGLGTRRRFGWVGWRCKPF